VDTARFVTATHALVLIKGMNKLKLLLIAVLFISCQSRKMVNIHRDKDSWGPYDSFVERILRSVKKSVGKSSHVVVAFTPITHTWMSGNMDFRAIVYNADNKRRYFVGNDSIATFAIFIDETKPKFKWAKFLLDNYLKGEINAMKAKQNFYIKDGGWSLYIYDIDLKNKAAEQYKFEGLAFDVDGNPATLEESYMSKYKKR
jgi:hypothetical protein